MGVDRDAVVPEGLAERFGFTVCRGAENSQVAALNTTLAAARGTQIAFLEDDDRWLPEFLSTAPSLQVPFVSSTQIQVDQEGVIERINDFPTPSGWLDERSVFDRIGALVGRWHIDNYFLGRLAEEEIERVHLVEAAAPVELVNALDVRQWLGAVLQYGGPRVRLHRHSNPYPLVIRRSHADSGVSHLMRDPVADVASEAEYEGFRKRFGRVPW